MRHQEDKRRTKKEDGIINEKKEGRSKTKEHILKGEKRIRAAGGNFFNILYVWIPKVKIERVVAGTDRGGFVRGVLRLSLE